MTGLAAVSSSAQSVMALVPSGRRVSVARLTLTEFRNYQSETVQPDGENIVLTGANGSGKTNLLEAVSFLSPGRGLRRARLSEVTRTEPENLERDEGRTWAVAARLVGEDVDVNVGTGLDPNPGASKDRRIVRVDGETERAQTALSEHLAVIWLTPQMDGLFSDGPGGRRRFLDRLIYVSDGAHAGRVSAYEKAMRERSRLLADHGRSADPNWLDALENTMVEKGMAVAAARRDMVARLRAFIEGDQQPFPSAGLSLSDGPEAWLDDMPALAAEDLYREKLHHDRSGDADNSRTATGPHRTDLCVRHLGNGRDAAMCSTGEQKALLIGLILAHARMQAAEHGRRPILLLDEVAAHLDAGRRAALFDILCALDTQVWMTGTDPELFTEMSGRARFYKVTQGAVHEGTC